MPPTASVTGVTTSAQSVLQEIIHRIKNAAEWEILNSIAHPLLGQYSFLLHVPGVLLCVALVDWCLPSVKGVGIRNGLNGDCGAFDSALQKGA